MLGRRWFDIYHLSFCLCRSASAVESKIAESDSWHHCEEFPSNNALWMSTSSSLQCSQDWPGQAIMRLFQFPSKLFFCFILHVFKREKLLTSGDHQRVLVMEKLLWFTWTLLVLSEVTTLSQSRGLNLFPFLMASLCLYCFYCSVDL